MTHKTYFANFFLALCASQSDDAFLAFAETVLTNLKRDPAANAADISLLEPLVKALQTAHQQRGPQGKAGSTVTLGGAVKNFLAWAQLTNTTKVFPAFPNREQAERVDIFPGGMDALYHANQKNILERAKYFLTKIGTTYTAQTKVTAAEAAAQYKTLEDALTGRRTASTAKKEGSAAVDEEEKAVCEGLYFVYGGQIRQHYQQPELAYAMFPFPQTTGDHADANLPSLPPVPHPAG